jgi:hypothetical protein
MDVNRMLHVLGTDLPQLNRAEGGVGVASRVWMRSCWSTKSKSIAKPGWVPGWSMGRVVMPRPVRWKGRFHQWLRRTLTVSLIFPTTWQNRCSVALVSCHSASGIGGNNSSLHPSVTRLVDAGYPTGVPRQRHAEQQAALMAACWPDLGRRVLK